MKIILAPDSFKGGASALELCQALARGIERACPKAEIVAVPLADGGEGTVAALVSATGGSWQTAQAVDPLGRPINSQWGLLGDGETAVIEMAAAAGLTLLSAAERNPLQTTTFGVGQLLLSAMQRGCRKIILGIGGSATSDGGSGMAQALGVTFYDRQGAKITRPMNGELMGQVAAIDTAGRTELLQNCVISAACDVTNPLLGPLGAVQVYSPQKGATPLQLDLLEKNMSHFIEVTERHIGRSIRNIPGTGAAGGLGAGLIAFAHATLQPGIQLVLDACRFQEKIAQADLIITGEGQVDKQTAYGKTISGILAAAAPLHIPVIILAGNIKGDQRLLFDQGATAMFSICPGPITLVEAMQHTLALTEQIAENIVRLWTMRSQPNSL